MTGPESLTVTVEQTGPVLLFRIPEARLIYEGRDREVGEANARRQAWELMHPEMVDATQDGAR